MAAEVLSTLLGAVILWLAERWIWPRRLRRCRHQWTARGRWHYNSFTWDDIKAECLFCGQQRVFREPEWKHQQLSPWDLEQLTRKP